MKKKLVIAEGIIVIALIFITALGINFINAPAGENVMSSNMVHTYLVKIPNAAGVCPYALESMTKGKLQMIDDSKCTCPYSQNASYMTTTCKDIRAIISLLPARLQRKVQVRIVDKAEKESNTKFM